METKTEDQIELMPRFFKYVQEFQRNLSFDFIEFNLCGFLKFLKFYDKRK